MTAPAQSPNPSPAKATKKPAPRPLDRNLSPVTLERLEALPLAVPQVKLHELSIDHLTLLAKGLHEAGERAESFSGIAATLQGLVLMAAKKRLPHGEYLPWVQTHLGKTRKTAALYVATAQAFLKCNPKLHLGEIVLALPPADGALTVESLDLAHPTVAAVASWTKGRALFQLRQEEVGPGGNQHPECPHCQADLGSKAVEICPKCGQETGLVDKPLTPEEQRAALLLTTREWAQGQLADDRVEKGLYKLLPDDELSALAAHFRDVAKKIDAWVKTPAKKREEMALEEVLS
jgi:hypothetical protein